MPRRIPLNTLVCSRPRVKITQNVYEDSKEVRDCFIVIFFFNYFMMLNCMRLGCLHSADSLEKQLWSHSLHYMTVNSSWTPFRSNHVCVSVSLTIPDSNSHLPTVILYKPCTCSGLLLMTKEGGNLSLTPFLSQNLLVFHIYCLKSDSNGKLFFTYVTYV